jgi:hypothetical protein
VPGWSWLKPWLGCGRSGSALMIFFSEGFIELFLFFLVL